MTQKPQELLSLTVPELIRRRAADCSDRLALSARSFGGWRERLSYAQLCDRMERMAAGLAERGLRADDRLAILLGNEAGRECFLTSLGALRLGAAVAPLSPRYSDDELAHALALSDPAMVVTSGDQVERIRRLRPRAAILALGSEAPPEGAARWPDPAEGPWGAAPAEVADPDRLACLLFTSGTTARAKAVMHSHRTMIGAGLCCSSALGLRPGDLYQGGWPFSTSSALNLGGMSSWVAGAAIVFEEPLGNAGRLRLIETERSTYYHGVPSVLHFIIDEFCNDRYDVSSLRRVGYGGSAMPPEVADRIAERWPQVEQVQIYGSTESGPTGAVLQPEDRREKAGSIGSAMPHCALRILAEDGASQPDGDIGEIALHGPGVALGYFRNAEATAEAFAEGGVRTGDLGYLDDGGFLHYTDRKKDVINRGGMKVASIAVEETLYRHPGVGEAAVVAVPHPALGEDVAACIVPADKGAGLNLEDIGAFCREKLSPHACPKHWFVLEALPKNPMGKVLKAELRKMLTERLADKAE